MTVLSLVLVGVWALSKQFRIKQSRERTMSSSSRLFDRLIVEPWG